jgi:serine/threonine protein kinase
LATVDAKPGRHPIHLVWNSRAWCPMACKLFASAAEAAREARILAALEHPNIVRQFGATEHGALLLEFLEGPTLAAMIDGADAPMSLSDALRAAIHVGGALQHMHAKRFVHLDLAPTNIIVTGRRPVLIDFGTARCVTAPRPSRVVGTDPYIAPEECALGNVTPAADVFGLAVLTYELLTRRRPFPRRATTRPFPQLDCEPTPLRRYRKGLPAKLEELIAACLSRNPEARPPLDELLPRLNGMIRTGRPMWPAGFQPGEGAGRPERPRALVATGSVRTPAPAG